MRARLILAGTMLAAVAHAQPTASQPTADAVLAEQIAEALVTRATELFEAKFYVDAKQLATEALVRSPRGTAAARARHLIDAINTATGVPSASENPAAKVDITPVRPPDPPAPTPPPITNEGQPTAHARTIASGAVWGAAFGGLFADAVSIDGTSAGHVALGAGIGAAAGGAAGYFLGKKRQPTRGDVALVDTLAAIGAAGGLTLGMLMQPAEGEAYSVNAMVGLGAGFLVGYIAGPETNTTERRMLRVAGISLAAGALPFLLYAGIYDDSTNNDEQLVGALSTAGLVGGAIVGFRLTRDLDAGKDRPADDTDAPIALVGRHSSGRWSANGIGVMPQTLSPQPGMTFALLGARW